MELLRPSSAEEATAALGNGSVALAGGTDLVPLLRDGLAHADTLVHVSAAVPRVRPMWASRRCTSSCVWCINESA